MSQATSRGDGRRRRPELIAVFDRETRRMGSMATLHNHAVADRLGLHATDQECLDLLDWTGPLAAGEIGMHLGLSSGAVTGLIDRLEAGGWVRRERDPRDRRSVIVHVSHERSDEVWALYEPLADREVPGRPRRQGPAGGRRVPRVRQRSDRRRDPSGSGSSVGAGAIGRYARPYRDIPRTTDIGRAKRVYLAHERCSH